MTEGYNILGVDIALRSSGVALYNTTEQKFPFYGTFKYRPKFDYSYESIISYRLALTEFMDTYVMPYMEPSHKNLFVVEGITRKGHYHTSIKLMICRTAMYEYIYQKEAAGMSIIGVISPTVQDWKKLLLGRANANKVETNDWLLDRRKKYSVPLAAYGDDDVVDAMCLVAFGMRIHKKYTKTE